VDAQLHAFAADSSERPWDPEYGRSGPNARKRQLFSEHVATAEDLLGMMDREGVAAAVLVHPPMYGWDNRYSVDAATRHRDRFRVVALVNPASPTLEDDVAALRESGVVVGIRAVVIDAAQRQALDEGVFERLFQELERVRMPLFIFAPGRFDAVGAIARRLPGLQVVVDHLGLAQPPLMPSDREPFAPLPSLLQLADLANVAVKCSGVPTLSRESYPFNDVWRHVRSVVDAFGAERVMWGTDITRVMGMHSYREAVSYLAEIPGLADHELELVMGATLRRLLRWQEDGAG
jgi:predicted TIM-barrel fold metal-dependent hydrolase